MAAAWRPWTCNEPQQNPPNDNGTFPMTVAWCHWRPPGATGLDVETSAVGRCVSGQSKSRFVRLASCIDNFLFFRQIIEKETHSPFFSLKDEVAYMPGATGGR